MRIWGEVKRRGRNALQVRWKDFGGSRKWICIVPKCRFHLSFSLGFETNHERRAGNVAQPSLRR